jgi:hypothetical protein
MQPTIADTTQPVTTHADATPTDIPRPDAPSRNGDVTVPHEDLRHSLSLDQVGNIYAERGFPRSARSLQRFCAGGHLDCEKVATTTGDKYLVAPYSVERHLKQLAQLAATEAATRPDMARQVATPVGVAVGGHDGPDGVRQPSRQDAPGNDVSVPDAEEPQSTSPLVAQLTMRIGEKDDEIKFLRGEVATKNNQLADASERDRETNILIQGLQSMVLQLTGKQRPERLISEAHKPPHANTTDTAPTPMRPVEMPDGLQDGADHL